MIRGGEYVVGRGGKSVSNQLSQATLQQLLAGSLACIRHQLWFDVTFDTKILTKLYEMGRDSLADGTGVLSIGPQVGRAFISESEAKSYFTESRSFWNRLRLELFNGLQNPVDALLEKFDKLWPAGATVGSYRGDHFSPGVFRWFQRGSSLNPHVDTSRESLIAPLCRAARLAANIYLDTTTTNYGGHLELWDLTLNSQQFELARSPDFSLRRDIIGPPDLSISPAPGDLIIFDAERIHAVSPIQCGTRLTASTFIGFSQLDGPATFFA